jgi:protease-4
MLRFLRLFLALLLSQVLLFVLFLFFVGAFLASRDAPPTIHPGSGLSVYLSGELVEYSTLPTVPFLREEPQTESVILEGLRRAAADPNITGVLLDFEAAALGWGMVQELHQAVLRYRESGKQAWAYGPMLDEVDLYLASACDSVFVPPHGKVFLNGIAFGSMYFRGLLDKAGVRPNVHRIGAYKDAAEPFTRTSMSEESRRQAEWLLDDLWEQLLGGIAAARKLERPALDAALQRGMLSGREAAALGLVDGERQHQDLVARFGHDHGKPRLIAVERYGRARDPAPRPGPGTIAVVHTRGLILAGRHTYSPGPAPSWAPSRWCAICRKRRPTTPWRPSSCASTARAARSWPAT